MLTGTYQLDGEVSQRLLRALPAVLVVRDQEWDCPVVPLLAAEIVKDEPGQEAVLDRLLDLLLISVLRAWFARPAAEAPGWYRAYSDPVVGRALGLLHHNPAHPWTVAALARECGASRATLARRFNDLVGEPPMAFLTSWRITLAADLLARTRRLDRLGGPPGRLPQPVRPQRRVQAGPGHQPAAVPGPRRGLSTSRRDRLVGGGRYRRRHAGIRTVHGPRPGLGRHAPDPGAARLGPARGVHGRTG